MGTSTTEYYCSSGGGTAVENLSTTTSRPRRTRNITFLSLLVMTCMTTSATAQQQQCSCAPREYTFKLDFSGTCPPLPPPFPPNDYFGAGVNDYTCSVGDSPVQDSNRDQPSRDPILRRLTDKEVDNALLEELLPDLVPSTQNIEDQVPVFISSIQFIQQDRKGNPIRTDMVNNKRDGDTFRFISSIVTRPDQIPYRITMVLRGFNAANESIQQLFTIDFTNKCGIPTFNSGEAIGWVIFDNLVPASDKTCPQSLPFPSGRPSMSMHYSRDGSGKSGKNRGSKSSSKATSSYGKGKSGKGGSSKSGKGRSSKSGGKGGYRSLHEVNTVRGHVSQQLTDMKEHDISRGERGDDRHLRRGIRK